ncbi:hypothetical protein FCK90_13620 [Kocuria coralli]|uniref:Alpha/beta hydrolase n=1 Tax=Kocuria coralli TaxID=1461025 RepID=A0A5J5KUF9_9MICC|nr:hypothetical protein [Kocuria coralli]KAA9393142.1 hypothetical protein FCK90_13620 [Kocuria coralli]
MIKGLPTWIGSGSEAVLAWIHTPEDAGTRGARGIVVVASPAGREQALSALAVRRLCILLAREGYVAVRFTWRGSGDSQPLASHDDAVKVWQSDVRSVTAGAKALLAADDLPVFAVGYRTGAAVLGSMAEDFDAVVSWEPVAGKTFVRQWSRLRHTVVPHVPSTEGQVDLLGMALTEAQAEQFSALAVPEPSETLVEVREAEKRRAKAMYGVEPFETRLHDDVLGLVVDALPAPDAQPLDVRIRPVLQNSWTDDRGQTLHERLVEVGADRRAGVVTWRDQEGSPGGFDQAHGLLVSGGGPDGRVGSGEWPHIARALASDGIVTLRVDRPLVGDSTPVEALRATNSYTLRSATSFRESTAWLREAGCTTISASFLCASAWAACLGEVRGAPVDASTIVLVGHAEWKMSEELWAEVRETYDADAPRGAMPVTNRAARDSSAPVRPETEIRGGLPGLGDRVRWINELARTGGKAGLKNWAREQAVSAVRTRLPYPLWRAGGRMRVMETPERVLEPMTRHARVVVLNGPDDLPRWEKTQGDRAVERLSAAGRQITSIASDRLDHSVLTSTGCRTVLETLRAALLPGRDETLLTAARKEPPNHASQGRES